MDDKGKKLQSTIKAMEEKGDPKATLFKNEMAGLASSVKSKSTIMEQATSKQIKKNVMQLQTTLQIAGKLGKSTPSICIKNFKKNPPNPKSPLMKMHFSNSQIKTPI